MDVLSQIKRPYRWIRDRRGGPLSGIQKGLYAQQLGEIIRNHPDAHKIILFTPSVEWGLTLFQRPQQLATAFAALGCLVFYSEPAPMQTFPDGFHQVRASLYVSNTAVDIFNIIPGLVVYSLAYNTKYLTRLPQAQVVYDYIDELSVFPFDLRMLSKNHRQMLSTAEVVVATADKLYQEASATRSDALLCPNAVDYEFITRRIIATTKPPVDVADLVSTGKPIIGYYGALARWMDYDLLVYAAQKRPDYQFVLIGPDHDRTVQVSSLLQQPNITWIGPKPYQDIPCYLKYFSAAMIPFKLNEITHATSPLKLFEYFAGHKPVVTTAMRECRKYPVVLIAEDRDDFIRKLDDALLKKDDPGYLNLLDATARENTWLCRAEAILQAL
jgi:glycosyltransferase involved in cell wall biosynthesis